MVEKTIELTEKQLEEVQFLEERGLTVGDGIDMLFRIKEDIEAHKEEIATGIEMFSQLNEQSVADIKHDEDVGEETHEQKKTYDEKIQDIKRSVSWTHDFFKF